MEPQKTVGIHPLRDFLRSKLIADVVATGAVGVTTATATTAVTQLEGENPILVWLTSLNWTDIIALVLKLIGLGVA